MKPYSYIISKPSEIEGVISAFRSFGVKGSSLLISIFTSYTKAEGLQKMVDALSLSFPEAEISGMTSSVCIEQGVNHTEKIIVLFEVFEKTYVHTICFDHEPGKEEAVGCAVMSEIAKISEPLCGIEILASQSDDRFSDFTLFLNVLTRELPTTLPVWGALTDSQTWPDHTYVFSKKYISTAGLILRVYTGEISIMLNHVLGFRPLSRPLTVTAMDGPMIIKSSTISLPSITTINTSTPWIFRSSRSPSLLSNSTTATTTRTCRRGARSMAASFSTFAVPSVQSCASPTAIRS